MEPKGIGKLDENMFIAKFVGHSMELRIQHEDYCVFRADVVGSREGRIVLVQYRGPEDPETGGSFTVKKFSSEKISTSENEWKHMKITLSPINPSYDPIILAPEEAGDVQVVAELIHVL